ncbi:hypothetical protein SBA3_2310030 [Candidatus Sulfopaludibacter sp. SbA3]|nr:hypothetical protein SBA3_2310030 [Candidatus Sulfopaludibacter sp. SbA3]
MKVMTILGTRPEIIRLSVVTRLLDAHADHTLVHTGQNYDDRLSRVFFDELGMRAPDEFLGVRSPSFAGQMGQILERSHELFVRHHPDRVLILGDTNSGLAALVARWWRAGWASRSTTWKPGIAATTTACRKR